MLKKVVLIILIAVIGVGVYLYSNEYHIKRDNYELIGQAYFLGTENKNPFVVMDSGSLLNPNESDVYEYNDDSFKKVFTYQYGAVHLIHDEIFGITKEEPSSDYEFQRIDIETGVITDVSYTGEIKESINRGRFFDVIDDNDDVIIIHHEFTDTVDGEYVSEQYIYVVDKALNEIAKMYDLSDYGVLMYNNADDILLEDDKIVFIANKFEDREDIVSIDYETDEVTRETVDQYGPVQFLNGKYCLISKDHRMNNTCRTIPEGKEIFLIELLSDIEFNVELFYDQEYVYVRFGNLLETYDLNGVMISQNEIERSWKYVLYDDHELVYTKAYEQGSFFIRSVIEVVYYDILEDEVTKRSKPKAIPTTNEEISGV